MSELSATALPAATGTQDGRGLRGSIGVVGVVFMVVAATAPLTVVAASAVGVVVALTRAPNRSSGG